MDNILMNAVGYFRPPENYFWQWADQGNVIEWRNGGTICYRDELISILKNLSPGGLPSLGTILLILGACKEDWVSTNKSGLLQGMLQVIKRYEKQVPAFLDLNNELNDALEFLHHVSMQSKEFRSGPGRIALLHVIFEQADNKIPQAKALNIIDVFNSGNVDRYIFKEGLNPPGRYFQNEIRILQRALKQFRSANELNLAIRTGIKQLPTPAELEIPETSSADLLEQLQKDRRTAGIARLTQRLIAALNIPMHSHGASDQLFGGVSDITNRGNYDRLLLSELAHDDLSLMARLANNEALYLRREDLPSNPETKRFILVDTTIKMWGLPRVFAVSTALACARNNKAKAHIQSYALSGNNFAEVNLANKEGIIEALEQLDASLHCGRALSLFMNQQKLRDEDEVFLITEEDALHNTVFQSILSALKTPINFLITVNRNGQLQFYEFIRGRRKLLNEAKFDLQQLLFNELPEASLKKQTPVQPAGLYFPASKLKFFPEYFYEIKKNHVVCVTLDYRVLYWNDRNFGARELINFIGLGKYCIGSDGESIIYIAVHGATERFNKLYKIDTATNQIEGTPLPPQLILIREIVFDSGHFYIKTAKMLYSFHVATGKLFPGKDLTTIFNTLLERFNKRNTNVNHIKKLVNNGYAVINTVKMVYINDDKEISIDDRHISFRLNSSMIIISGNGNEWSKKNKRKIAGMVTVNRESDNPHLKFSKFVFHDGSEVLADSRGLLILRSSNKDIPEITIVMIMGKPTACRAADGTVCGSSYFTGVDTTESRDINKFYNNYIQRYINHILSHGA